MPSRRKFLSGAGVSAALLAACEGESKDPDIVTKAAEALFGVDYTEPEREQMRAALADNLEAVRAVRALEKPNDLAPACVFDPRLPGVSYPAQANGVDLGATDPGPVPEHDDDIAYAEAWRQAAWLGAGGLASRRLTDIYLDRIERFAPKLECFVTVMAARARAEADAADAAIAAGLRRSPLHGLPYGLKDLFDAKGAPTTWGAEPYNGGPDAETDAEVTRRLAAAGAVLLGKTTCGALAYGDIWFGGVTRNPWNAAEGSSGSSAGSASAVAAGLASFAIGTETLGSIVSPSHRCGTTGLRPTFGRVSRAGGMALAWSLDKVGPICRSVADAALVLAAINGGDPGDPGAIDHGFSYDGGVDVSGMRVGYDPAWFEGGRELDIAAREAAQAAGATLVEVNIPEQPTDALVVHLLVEAAAAFEELTLTGRDDLLTWQDDEAWPNTFRAVRFISAVDLIQIDRVRRRAMRAMHDVFADVDVLMGPNFAGGMLTITNFTGHPQLALRAGFRETGARSELGREIEGSEKRRTPYATSIWAPLFEERRLIALGRAVEARLGVSQERPPLAL